MRRINPLLPTIPPTELAAILEKIEALASAIDTNPVLYEPIHCEHNHGVQRRNGSTKMVARSRAIVKSIVAGAKVGELVIKKAGKTAIAALVCGFLAFWYCEAVLWWF